MVGTTTPDLELWPIGNCQVSALVDREGAIAWACVPRVDGDPVFCSLLNWDNRDTGIWRFELVGQVSATQEYIRNTPILVTRLEAEDGSVVEVLDFCPRYEDKGRMYRPVAISRIVRPVAGSPRIRVVLRPMRDYGAAVAETTHGSNHIRYLVGPQALRLSTDAPVGYILEQRVFRIEQDNVASSVGTNPVTNEGIYTAIDGATTQGVELELAGELAPGWNITAGYTYARTRDADDNRLFGFPLATTKPEHVARLFSTYRLPGALDRVTVGGGLRWQSGFYGNIYSPTANDYTRIKQGGYTLVDLMGRYQYNDHLSFTLNANNVFDKRYLAGLGNFDTTYYGEARNLMLTTRWAF